MRKSKILLIFMIFIYSLTITACVNLDNKNNIVAPNNNSCPIEGTWQFDFSNLDKDSKLRLRLKNKDVIINSKYIILGNEVCKSPDFKVKTVKTEEYFLYKLRLNPNKLNLDKKEIEVISTSLDNNPFYDFIKIDEKKLLVYVDNQLLVLTKKSNSSSIEPKHNIIEKNSQQDIVMPKRYTLLRTGVLIGLKSSEEDYVDGYKNEKKYRTIFISSRNRNLKNVIETENLFVPRKDGFCEIGVNRINNLSNIQDNIFVNPLYNNYPIKNNFRLEQDIKNKSIYRDILFVSNDYISIEYNDINKDKPIDLYKVKMLPIDNINAMAGVNIGDIIDKDSEKILASSLESCIRSKDKDILNKLERSCRKDSFFLSRRNGHWILKGRLNGIDDKEEYIDFNISTEIPKKILNYDDLNLSWNSIKSKVPNALDAYTSPNKDLAIITTEKELYVYTIEDGKLSNKAIYEMELNKETVVMAEWATADYAKKWTDSILKNKNAHIIK
ncbi:lipoprotein [Clostridium botulinum]|uniref:lipoprotein n=1 Tax=Clostridium botulinum TaxID=1491 RepID=UPI0001591F7F|nr:lipoprotein [Clostridium botulinum]ABS33324.1 putative lipoprotein [Clostridium botulinum A str. ATCC 19397]ABS38119.1 putative lipoprotein [Clostridium botulinum A str. Hall]AWB16268.1 lipoprotein [Clostridium botulinum]EGT5616847.1 lipoprotein [Clostridium botulinum]EGT5621481.1 lipoprotein [Clostridium botulinum]